ncbi:hypothetical protein MAR_028720, partial [Mya arenaria]
MGSCGIMLRPSKIRFSQCSISNTFTDGTLIGELVDDIYAGRCFASAVKPIEVSKIREKWYTSDNRRLWVFRQLELLGKLKEIRVKVIEAILPGKMSNRYGGKSITIRNGGDPGGITHRMVPQCTISNTFKNGALIKELVDDINAGRCLATAVKPIEVSEIDKVWYTSDNRRLWVFQQLELIGKLKEIRVKVIKKIWSGKMTNEMGGTSIVIKNSGDPGGKTYTMVPQVPMKQTKTSISKKAGKSLQQFSGDKTIPVVSTCKKTSQPACKRKQANDTDSSLCISMKPKKVKVGGGSSSKPSNGSTSMKPIAVKVAGGSC